ncbi:hypothetical protein QJS10_CPB15g01197 [Acorus calamus]|uniref:Uncharacterized protein n=1 Tax=Acorus calamus TaxID=4465 RepID=A0AAV9D9Y8_ACOCL|nr:hypothetical protein QJS10_CPB15g01197 [Acorus calamus]
MAVSHYLSPGISDHAPIRTSLQPPIPLGPRPFKYFEIESSSPVSDLTQATSVTPD